MKKVVCRTLLPLTLLMSVFLTGCRGTGPDQNEINEQVIVPKVKIAYIVGPSPAAQILAGKEGRIFEDHLAEQGLKAQYEPIRNRGPLFFQPGMARPEFIYLNTAAAFTHITDSDKTGDLDNYTIIAGSMDNTNPFTLTIRRPHVKSLQDLNGKTVGILNHDYIQEMLLNKNLAGVGLKTRALGGTVIVRYQDYMKKFLQDFSGGKFDAVTSLTTFQGGGPLGVPEARLTMSLNSGKTQLPYVCLAARNDIVQKNPELVKTVLRAHLRATERALAQKEKLPVLARKSYDSFYLDQLQEKDYQKYPDDYFSDTWKANMVTYSIDTGIVKDVYDFEVKAGYLKNKKLLDVINLGPLNQVLKEQGKPPVK